VELMTVARILWSRRLIVAVGFLGSLAIGLIMMYHVSLGLPPQFKSRQHYVGESTAQVLIDTPSSQIADASSGDPAVLNTRASLLADVVATAPLQEAIAGRLGIPPEQLAIAAPPLGVGNPIKATALGNAGSKLPGPPAAYSLSMALDPNLPIIAFDAMAPTPRQAQALAATVITILRSRMALTANAQDIPDKNRTVLNTIAPPVAGWVAQGSKKLMGAGVALAVFLVICFLVVVISGTRARRRAAAGPPAEAPEEAEEMEALAPRGLLHRHRNGRAADEARLMTGE
jgi:Na+-transporting methylmalonyl-CoA/oxaloacetate decarboxylase gamma subunit